jgi:hypothetical protein
MDGSLKKEIGTAGDDLCSIEHVYAEWLEPDTLAFFMPTVQSKIPVAACENTNLEYRVSSHKHRG